MNSLYVNHCHPKQYNPNSRPKSTKSDVHVMYEVATLHARTAVANMQYMQTDFSLYPTNFSVRHTTKISGAYIYDFHNPRSVHDPKI